MLLSDSAEQYQEPVPTNEREAELLKRMKEAKKSIHSGLGLGVISPDMVESYFRLICFSIAYKTGTSLKDIQNMSFFDLFTYSYIVNKFSEESGTEPTPNIPEQRDITPLGI